MITFSVGSGSVWRTVRRIGWGGALLLVAGLAQANISDDFARTDSPTVGNGWIEKTPAAFSIQAGGVAKVAAGNGYLDNLVYRPASENVLDVEASIEIRLLSANPGFPQIHVRVQSATVGLAGSLDSYLLYIDGSLSGAVLGRQRGSGFVTTLAEVPLSPAMTTGDTYRMRLRATGTNPVQLVAVIERQSGGNWETVGQAFANDSSSSRISTAGSVGFSGYVETAYRLDNFVRTNLSGLPPPAVPPSLTSLSPLSATVGSSAAMVTIRGAGFTASSVARWNGQPRATTFVSSSELRVQLVVGDLAADSIGALTVANGTTVSTPENFFVVPANTALFSDSFNRAASQTVGNAWIEKLPSAFEILASGILGAENTYPYDFHDAIVYRPFSESQLNVETGVEFVRSAGGRFPQLHARIQGNTITQPDTLESYILYLEDGLSPPELAIAVQPPILGEGECIIRLARLPSTPQVGVRYRLRFRVVGVYPVQLWAAMERFNGSAWEPFGTAEVTHDASTVDAGFYCPPNRVVPAPISSPGSTGLAKWFDRVDGYDNFYWRSLPAGEVPPPPPPQLTGMSPSSRASNAGGFALSVTGTNFVYGASVRWNGSDRPTTFVSSGQLTATISAADLAEVGTAQVTVSNPSSAGGPSPQSLTFTITAPEAVVPQISGLSPASRAAGSGAFALIVNGSSFQADSVVRWNGSSRPTTFVSPNQLSASITAADIAAAGSAAVTVFNPGQGGAASPQTATFTIFVLGQTAFFDDFARVDGSELGNGWIEKAPSAFSLEGGQARKLASTGGYRDNVAYRPATESILNSEVSAEMRVLNSSVGYPQIFARLQADSAALNNQLNGYILYFNASPTQAILGRQIGSAFVETLATLSLTAPLNTSDLFRLRLRATGTAPVQLQAVVERFSGGNWAVIGQGSATDASGSRIATAGVGGLGGFVEGSYAYDNFSVTTAD